MSFGFGVGDFVAVATLAWKVSTALRSAKGASASYHNLISELESTAQSLYQAGKQLETAGLPASPANCISHGISRCHTNLRSLEIIIKKYAESMQMRKGKEKDWHSLWGVKTELKKISWEMYEKEGVDEIRQNIRSGVAEIMLILEACGLNAMGRMESKINAMGRMETKIRETCAVVKRVEAAIPQGLGAWHWDHKVIYLDDALGRSIPIAFELCSQWEVFNETLKLAFRGRPGSSWIRAKLFKITTQDNEQVFPANWACTVKPSTTLLMSMVVQKHRQSWENSPICCPVCDEPQSQFLVAGKSERYAGPPMKQQCRKKPRQIQCTKCFISFSVSDINDPVEVTQNVDMNADNPNRLSTQEEDIKSFKRLDLVQVRTVYGRNSLAERLVQYLREKTSEMDQKTLRQL